MKHIITILAAIWLSSASAWAGGPVFWHPPYTYTESTNAFQAWSELTQTTGGTCTVTFAKGPLLYVSTTNSITLTFDNANFPTNGISRVGIELWCGTNSVAFDTTTITNSTSLTLSTNAWNSLFFRRVNNNSLWNVRQ